ncbi:hypothetical protein BUALT_Bualt16G0017200 [Buddleja alternifolia]|uniref:VWFA domain-containing protein n=1 Tax=Buddleja alternifolia TaxID=168488 RepID=A0AAV6WET9_9LAMI|nr:hypothetical protein BUALT_Bualt16G0017200 [Buddleja alternifolia]
MGNKSSSSSPRDGGSWRQSSTAPSSSSSGWQHDYSQASFSNYAQNYPVQHPYPAPPVAYPPPDQYPAPQNYESPPQSHAPPQNPAPPSQLHVPHKKLDKRYSTIADNYRSLEEVTEALARAGLESSNLIVGIDFTKSNEWTGKRSYNGRSLHHIGSGLNPYEQAISIVGKTLVAFDEDNLIPCYGFGDASTHDQDVFGFYPDERFCNGFEEVLSRYRELVPHLKLAGPTSFAPIIEMAMTVVEQSGGQYHVLLIIADGQVTRSVDTEHGQLSPQEQKTVQAIVEASKLPLSIILVGVGDGPWDTMKEFDDNIPAREFDNFQFVNFTEIMSKNANQIRKETEFALSALMEIPTQYKATIELNLLGRRKGNIPERVALPPPVYRQAFGSGSKPSRSNTFQQSSSPYYEHNVYADAIPSAPSSNYGQAFGSDSKPSHSNTFQQSSSLYYEHNVSADAAPSAPSSNYEHQICPICLSNPKDMAFGCGHQEIIVRHFLLRDVYDDMMLDGVKPERDTFHSLIVGTMKGSRMQDAFFFRDEMKSMGLVPDAALYNYLISTCGKCMNSDQAISILDEMKRSEVKPTGQTYICLLHACAASGRLDRVYAIVRDMTAAGLGLNKFCYAGLITAHKNKRPLTDDTASKIIELVEQSKGWSSVDQSKDIAENVMMGITEEELYNLPTAQYIHRRGGFIGRPLTVYHVAFHACAELCDVQATERLMEMFEKEGRTPDVFILMQVMRCFLHGGDIDRGLKIFEDYMNSNKTPMVELYVTLAEGAMVGYTPRGMQLAQETLVKMISKNFFLNFKMADDLLLAASGEKTGGYTTANLIWDMMQNRNLTPSLPAVEAYHNGLKLREIPEDDPRLLLVSRTLNNLRLKVGTGGGGGGGR